MRTEAPGLLTKGSPMVPPLFPQVWSLAILDTVDGESNWGTSLHNDALSSLIGCTRMRSWSLFFLIIVDNVRENDMFEREQTLELGRPGFESKSSLILVQS